MDKCLVSPTERDLADALADGRITEHDADEVRDFAQLLRVMGRPGGPRTVDEMVAMEEYSHDRNPEFAGQLRQIINERRSRGGC